MITKEFIDKLPENPINGAIDIVDYFEDHRTGYSSGTIQQYKAYIEAWLALEQYSKYHKLNLDLPSLVVTEKADFENCDRIEGYFSTAREKLAAITQERFISRTREKYASLVSGSFSYNFTQPDVDKILELIEELRTNIEGCSEFEDDHKQRVLKKLDSLKMEVGRTLTNLDKFYGLLGEIAFVGKKYGRMAEPIIKTSWKLYRIFVAVQAIANGLPTGTELEDVNPLPLELLDGKVEIQEKHPLDTSAEAVQQGKNILPAKESV